MRIRDDLIELENDKNKQVVDDQDLENSDFISSKENLFVSPNSKNVNRSLIMASKSPLQESL